MMTIDSRRGRTKLESLTFVNNVNNSNTYRFNIYSSGVGSYFLYIILFTRIQKGYKRYVVTLFSLTSVPLTYILYGRYPLYGNIGCTYILPTFY